MKRFLETIFGPAGVPPRWLFFVVAALVGLGVVGFWNIALKHGALHNVDPELNDQSVYFHIGQNLKSTHYEYMVPRMRMPLYGYYLSLFLDGNETDEQAFAISMRANIGLTIACALAMTLAFRIWLGWGYASAVGLLSAGTWLIERAAYVQPEVLLATLIGVTCAMLAETLRAPAWWKALVCGLLIATWHMTKASGPLILVLFFTAWSVKVILPGSTPRRVLMAVVPVVIAGFLLPISPYLMTSWRVFGSPFYNTQSKFFFWCESDAEKHALQDLDVHRRRPTPDELAYLPSASKFFAKHSLADVRNRLTKGFGGMMTRLRKQHPELIAAEKMAAVLLIGSVLVWRRRAWQLVRERPAELLFVCMVVGGFASLFAWMHHMKTGPRMIASIHLVPLFFCVAWMREIQRGATISVCGMTLSVERLIAGCIMLPVAFWLGWRVITCELLMFYMGA